MKIKIIATLAVVVTIGMGTTKFSNSKNIESANQLFKQNVEALSAGGEGGTGGTGYTGPRTKYDCPGIFTGDGFNCNCTNKYDCTPQDC